MEVTAQLLIFEQGIPEPSVVLNRLQWDEKSPFLTILTDEKSIKIEHIRDLQSELGVGTPEPRLVVITPGERITLPAQQALLKLLEEPPANTRIVIPVRSPQSLLPTIQSRCVVVRANAAGTHPERELEAVLWQSWSTAKTLREKVGLTQKFAGKKEEVQQLLGQELIALSHQKASEKSVTFRQRLLECLEAVQGNVSPQLCLERLLLSE